MLKCEEVFHIQYVERHSWAQLKDMACFLREEWQVHVHCSTISRTLEAQDIKEEGREEGRNTDWIAQVLGLC